MASKIDVDRRFAKRNAVLISARVTKLPVRIQITSMPAPSALSVDEFAALVAATLSDLDGCGQACVGDNINSVDGQVC